MIVGVDESGSFNCKLNEYSLFASVIIPTENEIHFEIEKEYNKWKNKLSSNCFNKNGEVKGELLQESELNDFIENVLLPYENLRVYFLCIDKTNKEEIIQKHKGIEVAQLDYSIQNFQLNKTPKRQTNYIISIRNWVNKRNRSEYLKIFGLRHCVFNSLRNSMIYYFSHLKENELIDCSYKVDKDFINDENIYWKGYLKRLLLENSKQLKLPLVEDWNPTEHPFFKKYPLLPNNRISLNAIFKDHFSFDDSVTNFEIQFADICGIIFYRYFNHNKYKELFEKLKTKALLKDTFGDRFILKDFDYDKKLKELIQY